jgi:hypothetical protein
VRSWAHGSRCTVSVILIASCRFLLVQRHRTHRY